jgi:phosphoribosylformylglycinamidine synthase
VPAPDGTRDKGVAITVDCNSRFVYLDPYEGARLAVAEAASNLVAVGADPLAVTDCLNFGNPERPEIMWQFAQAVQGMGDACRALGTPIVSGNVSFYNETDGKAIFPTPMIGMVGLLPDARGRVTQFFRKRGAAVALIGAPTGELGGSEYLKRVHGKVAGRPPRLDVEKLRAAHALVLALARANVLQSAHDVAAGGLAACLAECSVSGPEPIGLVGTLAFDKLTPQEILFGEEPGRFVVSFFHEHIEHVKAVQAEHPTVPMLVFGSTGEDALTLHIGKARMELDIPLATLAEAWRGGFRGVVEG